jgi:hypothetical protein
VIPGSKPWNRAVCGNLSITRWDNVSLPLAAFEQRLTLAIEVDHFIEQKGEAMVIMLASKILSKIQQQLLAIDPGAVNSACYLLRGIVIAKCPFAAPMPFVDPVCCVAIA